MTEPPVPQPLDARLVPAAAAAWAAAYLALGLSAGTSILAAGVLGVAAAIGLLAGRGWTTVLAAAAGCAAAAMLITGLRVAARDSSPLTGPARDHASAEV